MKLRVTVYTPINFSGELCDFQERAPSQWRKCRWHWPDPELRDLRRPCDGEALRRRLLRRLQGLLQALRAKGTRIPGKYGRNTERPSQGTDTSLSGQIVTVSS